MVILIANLMGPTSFNHHCFDDDRVPEIKNVATLFISLPKPQIEHVVQFRQVKLIKSMGCLCFISILRKRNQLHSFRGSGGAFKTISIAHAICIRITDLE